MVLLQFMNLACMIALHLLIKQATGLVRDSLAAMPKLSTLGACPGPRSRLCRHEPWTLRRKTSASFTYTRASTISRARATLPKALYLEHGGFLKHTRSDDRIRDLIMKNEEPCKRDLTPLNRYLCEAELDLGRFGGTDVEP
jgi:hypothetical protein